MNLIDAAGNIGSGNAMVDWIDRTAPSATLNYSTTQPTNSDVVASLVPSEAITVTNNGGSNNKAFTENGEFTFEFIDAAGNPGSAIATVSWIDRIAPSATLSYSTTNPTNSDVMVSLDPE